MSADALHYRSAGVDIGASDDAKSRIARIVASTHSPDVLGGFGGFGGMFRVPSGMRSPILVSSADGVGTKIKIAIETGRHDTIGHDLVNHCVNDILVQGAAPLFFLDYVAFGVLDPVVLEAIVSGVAAGCKENGCSLVGGETAEMPGLYNAPDYDLAGFIVGCVEEDAVPGAHRVRAGDVLIGLESSGLHTNGYSLARKVLTERMKLGCDDLFPGMDVSVSDLLLTVHRSYLRALMPVMPRIHAMAHITGGGLPGNLNRSLPDTLDAVIEASSWEPADVFQVIGTEGNIDGDEMFRVFNMGVGMVVIASAADASAIIQNARVEGIVGWELGAVTTGSGNVVIS
ncbi:MAG TPA: phosphoribosylformylglycinamidine cyclo-ligase [Gemmatimonadaceae bacterium]|nr:phosphoribosylformylglycinamidine cyclo-ligase [Gemmatimonadaceae bacterium]